VEVFGRQPELLRYYRDALGLPVRDARDDWGTVELGGQEGAALVPGQNSTAYSGASRPGSVALVFEVDDFDDAIAELRARGVAFSWHDDDSGRRAAHMRGPDGLMHVLVESIPVSSAL